jgi:hypothetical protein
MRRVGLFLVVGLVLTVVLVACGKEAEQAPAIVPSPVSTPLWAPAWAPPMAPNATPEPIMATTSASSTKTTP